MKEIKLKARAKINLSLDVLGKREDGYHELLMIMQSIELGDELTIKIMPEKGIRLTASGIFIACDKDNLAYRAAELILRESKRSEGVHIHIDKQVPLGSGMAGGSADAAAVLIGLNHVMGLNLPMQALMDRALKLGADVPFMMVGGTMLAEGIGEKLSPLPYRSFPVLIVKPETSMSTKRVYQQLHLQHIKKKPDTQALIDDLKQGRISLLASHMRNVLESVTEQEIPEISQIKKRLILEGALGAMMSGSGSAVFGIFETKAQADKARKSFEKDFAHVYQTVTSKKGVEIQ